MTSGQIHGLRELGIETGLGEGRDQSLCLCNSLRRKHQVCQSYTVKLNISFHVSHRNPDNIIARFSELTPNSLLPIWAS